MGTTDSAEKGTDRNQILDPSGSDGELTCSLLDTSQLDPNVRQWLEEGHYTSFSMTKDGEKRSVQVRQNILSDTNLLESHTRRRH